MVTKFLWAHIACVGFVSILSGCGEKKPPIDPVEYNRQIEQWRQTRVSRLTSETGWLTLCGLFWLKEGPNRCGSDSSNDILFPAGRAPAIMGTLWRTGMSVRFVVRPGIEVRQADSVVKSLVLVSDADSTGPTILTLGNISFYVIQRGDKVGVRVKDKENPARLQFKGLDYFPVELRWRIEATFERYAPPHIVKIASMVNTVEEYSSPGALVFEHEGRTYRIDALAESGVRDQLYIMFSDRTSGIETYGGGRQLYADLPDAHDKVVLDFNKAYNWPCVFTEYATCPIPPAQNRLPFRVEAGEKMYAGHE